MDSLSFKKWNTLLGWCAFAIALITYTLTVEPTNSFWDCGEYITAAAKLEVAHPPGAPLLQMLGAFFALFATTPAQIALMVNYVSVVSSAFTILFLFWTLTELLIRILGVKKEETTSKQVAILGSSMIGALAFTFSDSFWFNAVETEVYATASFIMALLLWMGLKWTAQLHQPRGNRWLVLIAFIVGLTFGVQFMGFLAIPSIGMLYYFKQYKRSTVKRFFIANFLSVMALLLVYKFSLTYVLQLFGWAEVFFVNQMGLPFNTGSLIMGIFFLVVFAYALQFTAKRNYRLANTIVLSMMFLFLGFSSWLMLPIRANANVTLNENNPSDARTLLAYYNREQYQSTDSPFYGAYYTDKFAPAGVNKDDKPKYEKDLKQEKYVIVNAYQGAAREANAKHQGLLPRMWSREHAANYIRYYGAPNFTVKRGYQSNGELMTAIQEFRKNWAEGEVAAEQYVQFLEDFDTYIEVQPITLWDNTRFLFHFQLNYMYWRYFMWNFAGRQNDIQGRFDGNGNWLSGFQFIDSWRLGSQENLPTEVLDNKGRNTYFFLPLLLGIIGILFQLKKNPKQFWVLLVFFVFTGIAIQFYTNPYIFQPRERDYSLVGSFYVFCLWIGLGVYGLYDGFMKWKASQLTAPITVLVCLLAVPGLMAFQNWDDHDRSGRYTANAMAKAYLDSLQKDAGAILFTIGDNDTFPLWYAQEIEEYRTDARIMVTTYSYTDWYIDQMKRKAYKSDPIPSQLTHRQYQYGTRDAVYYQPLSDTRWEIKDFMNWIASDHPKTKIKSLFEQQGADLEQYTESELDVVFYPTNKIRVPVHKENAIHSGLVKEKDSALMVAYLDIDLPQTAIGKNSLIMLDILANNNWERPLYFSGGSFDDAEFLWLKDYLQLDGLVYKLVPIKTPYQGYFEMGRIDSELMYTIVMQWDWGNSGSPDIYHDPQTRRQALTYRSNLGRLVETLLAEEKITKARDIIDVAMKHMPVAYFDHHNFVLPFFDGYYQVGETAKARDLFIALKKIYQERLMYYEGMAADEQYQHLDDIIAAMEGYRRVIDVYTLYEDSSLAGKERLLYNTYLGAFERFFKS